MSLTPTLNRLRHIVRRAREVPPRFLWRKLALTVRPYVLWPGYASRRRSGSAGPSHRVRAGFSGVSERFRESLLLHTRLHARAQHVEARAVALVRGSGFPCLGYGYVSLPSGDGWHEDATSHFSFGDAYFPRVNFLTHGRDADVKVPWELSRLQWLVWLAEAAIVSEDRRLEWTDEFWSRFEEWCRANPPGYGPNWTIAMEVAIRALNLAISAALMWPELTPSQRDRLADVLDEHRVYLRRFPELSDHLGNHFLVALSVRALLDHVVLEVDVAERIAPQEVAERLAEQFTPDGLHSEHAPLYHRLCTESLLWAVAALSRAGAEVVPALRALALRACIALRHLELGAVQGLPVLGDADSGQLYLEGEPTRRLAYLRGLLGAGAEAPGYLVGLAGGEVLSDAARALGAAPGSSSLRVGPFLTLRSSDWTVVARAGVHGLHGRASHDHDDNGSPWIAYAGRDVVVDAGCFAYTRNPVERLRDMSSAAHNLVLVDGRSRFRPKPGSMSPTVADAPVPSDAHLHDGMFELRLDWIDAVAGAVRHGRTVGIEAESGSLRVVDDVRVATAAPLQLLWHVAPGWQVQASEGGFRLEAKDADATMRLDVTCEGGACGPAVLSTARFSPRYGAWEHLTTISIPVRKTSSVRLVSQFSPVGPRA